jgi:hypothetical protein
VFVVVVVVCIGCGVVQRALQEGVDIVVATPAKAKDLMEQGCGPTPSLLSLLLPLSPHCVCVCVVLGQVSGSEHGALLRAG